MADRSGDQYKKWSEHRLLAGILTFLENLLIVSGVLSVYSRLRSYCYDAGDWVNHEFGCYGIHLCVVDAAVTTGFVLVDVSDIINFPHNQLGIIHLTGYQISINPDEAFIGQVLIGFLDRVDSTDGSFRPLFCWKLEKKSSPVVNSISFYNGPLVAHTTTFLVPGNLNDATFQTDVALASPHDNVAPFTTLPGTNDIVMKVVRTAGEVNLGVTLKYFVKKP